MRNNIMFFIIAIILATIITIMYHYIDKANKKREKQNMFNQTEEITNNIQIEIENLTEEEYKRKLLQQLQSMNINLVELNYEISKQNKRLKKIENDVDIIKLILIIPIIIGISIFLLKTVIGYNILQDLTESFNYTPTATVHVEDENGNIIYNEEYHGQNVAAPVK